MKRHSAVIFPDTVPDEQLLFPLVTVFHSLVYFQPVENDQRGDGNDHLEAGDLCRSRYCETTFPAPLGDDKDRFVRLLDDLRHRGDDYAAQLSHLSLASIGKRAGKEMETKGSIVSSLLAGHDIKNYRPNKKEMVLWQARLILKLGEFFDEDQRMLDKEIEKITQREKGLITELRKESEQSFSFTERLFSSSSQEDGLQRLRLKAWARIFALGTPKDAPHIFVTREKDAFDRLVEQCERSDVIGSAETTCVVLPAKTPSKAQATQLLQEFSKTAGDFIDKFNEIFNGNTVDNNIFAADREWGQLLEQYFPEQSCGRCLLTLYSLKQVSAPRLFLETFGLDDDIKLSESVTEKKANGYICLLSDL